jgi:hypothetical protein
LCSSSSRFYRRIIHQLRLTQRCSEPLAGRDDQLVSSSEQLLFSRHPVQSQSRDEEEKYEHDAELDEKEQDQSSEFFLVDFEEVRRPGDAGVPKQSGRGEIEQGEDEADDKCGEEKIPEENDFVAFHVAIIHFERRQINNEYESGNVIDTHEHAGDFKAW